MTDFDPVAERGTGVQEDPGEVIEYPPMHEGLLDDRTVLALLDDLAAEAQILEILTKGGPQLRAAGAARLDEAFDALVDGSVRGVQVRYRHDGQEWWDTLLRAPGGFRLVRVKQR